MASLPSISLSKVKLGLSVVIFLLVLAVLTFFASAWGESHFQGGPVEDRTLVEYVTDGTVEFREVDEDWATVGDDLTLEENLSFRTDSKGELGIYFGSADLVRLFSDTEVVFEAVDLDSDPMQIDLKLVSGSVWLSNIQSITDISLLTDRVGVMPEDASVFVDYSEGEVMVFASHHPVRISFWGEFDEEWDEQLFLNDYLLTESHEVSIRESRITDTVGQLRYTKLTKEYPFSYVDEDDWDDVWTSALAADRDRLIDVYADFISVLRRQGDEGFEEGTFSFYIDEFYKQVRFFLTFSEAHQNEIQEEDDLDLLYQVLYLILEEDEVAAVDRLVRFQTLASDFENLDKLDFLIQVFQAVNYGSDFYPVKDLLRELRLNAVSDDEYISLSLVFLRERLNEVYNLLDSGDLRDAKDGLYAYNDAWKSLISELGSDLVSVVQNLTEERQILQNLLYREEVFYEVDSYEVLSELEDRILTLTAEEYDLNEERQDFVQDKIVVLNRLVDLIDEGVVGIDDGTDLGEQLILGVEMLLEDITSETAIFDYFVEKLEELVLQFEFINSSDYLLGEGTFDERFEVYLENQEDLSELSDYIKGITETEAEDALSLEDAVAEISVVFEEYGVTYISLISLDEVDYRLFQIEGGHVGGISFEANYDRVTGIVYDLEVDGETFFAGVKLGNLYEAVSEATAQEEDEEEILIEAEDQELSPVEELAITLIRRTLETETGLDFKDAVISIVDLDLNLFSVIVLIEYRGDVIIVQFQYAAPENVVFDVVGEVDGQIFTVDDVEIGELYNRVLEMWIDLQAESTSLLRTPRALPCFAQVCACAQPRVRCDYEGLA